MKTIRAKQAKVHSAYFAQRDQDGIIARDLTQSSILMWRFPCSCRRSVLNSLLSSCLWRTLYFSKLGSIFSFKTAFFFLSRGSSFFFYSKTFLNLIIFSPNKSLVFVGWIFSATKRHYVMLAITTVLKAKRWGNFSWAFVSEQRFSGRPADGLWKIACISSSSALDERVGPQNV